MAMSGQVSLGSSASEAGCRGDHSHMRIVKEQGSPEDLAVMTARSSHAQGPGRPRHIQDTTVPEKTDSPVPVPVPVPVP